MLPLILLMTMVASVIESGEVKRVREMERKRVGHIHSVSQYTELEPACQVHPEFYLKFKLERFNYFAMMKVIYVASRPHWQESSFGPFPGSHLSPRALY